MSPRSSSRAACAAGLTVLATVGALALAVAWLRTALPSPEGCVVGPHDASVAASAHGAPPSPGDHDIVRESEAGGNVVAFRSETWEGVVRADARPDGIAVLVRGADGAPRPELGVTVEWNGDVGHDWVEANDRGVTDAAGVFRTSVPRLEMLHSVVVDTPELGELAFAGTFVPSDRDERQVVLVVPAAALLSVNVAGAEGRPIPSATVRVAGGSMGGVARTHRLALAGGSVDHETDDRGELRLSLPAGRCEVSAWSDEHAVESLACDLPPGPCSLSFTLPLRVNPTATAFAGRPVAVHVVLPVGIDGEIDLSGQDGVPAPRAAPHVLPAAEGRRFLDQVRKGPTDFVIGAPDQRWWLYARVEGCSQWGRYVEVGEDSVTVNLERDPRLVEVRGNVVTPDRAPVAATIQVFEGAEDVARDVARADEHGAFRFWRKREPPFHVAASADGFAPVVHGPIAGAAERVDVELVLQAAGTVAGTLVDASGAPVAGSVVLVRPTGSVDRPATAFVPGCFLGTTRMDQAGAGDDGAFRFATVGSGEHVLFARVDRGDWPVRAIVRAGETIVLRSGDGLDGLARVEGVAHDPLARRPLGGLSVYGTDDTTDAEGRFWLVAVPGTHALSLCGEGRAVTTVRTRLVAGSQRVEIAVPSAELRFLRFVDASGRPVEGIVVRVRDDDAAAGEAALRRFVLPPHEYVHEVGADANGRVDLRGLPAGPLRLAVQRWQCLHGCRVWPPEEREYALGAADGVREVIELRW